MDELGKRISRRYALLLRQLGEERAHKRGWKQEVADLLAIHPTYVSKLLAGTRPIGGDVLERAIHRLHVHSTFFTHELTNEDALHYRDFIIRPGSKFVGAGRNIRLLPEVQRGRPWSEVKAAAREFLRSVAKEPLSGAGGVLLGQCVLESEIVHVAQALDGSDPKDPWTGGQGILLAKSILEDDTPEK